jgi:hypothetical protein
MYFYCLFSINFYRVPCFTKCSCFKGNGRRPVFFFFLNYYPEVRNAVSEPYKTTGRILRSIWSLSSLQCRALRSGLLPWCTATWMFLASSPASVLLSLSMIFPQPNFSLLKSTNYWALFYVVFSIFIFVTPF